MRNDYDDQVITSFETLCADARTRMITAQGQHLVLAYMRSLLRRRDARIMMLEEIRDEVAIALAGRAPPVFGFITIDSKAIDSKHADIEIRGSITGHVALMGEIAG
jgi:hypothetical protein